MLHQHTSVLLKESVSSLNIKKNGTYVDATFGRGGHTRAILEKLDSSGKVIAFDCDHEAKDFAKGHFAQDKRFFFTSEPFLFLNQSIEKMGVSKKVHGVLLDLGVSSPQLDNPERGFSFLEDGPLDMRMNINGGVTAAQWLSDASLDDIKMVLKDYGEERYFSQISNAIIKFRQTEPIKTTKQLSDLVCRVVPKKERSKHPATRTFLAIRIHINNELDALSNVLEQSLSCLIKGGRIVVISFHSLEDRIVKRFFRQHSKPEPRSKNLPPPLKDFVPQLVQVGSLTRPTEEECIRNPRARSAKMRVAEKI